MYDLIVVGARCAGASLAMLLAQKGAKVLLLDRATFPSDIPNGHFIHRHGPQRLLRWGLLDRVAAISPPITSQLSDLGDFPLLATDLYVDGAPWAYGPRRRDFDRILVEAAVQGGAELREGFNVDEFLFDGDRLVCVRGHSRDGGTVEERGVITVGADGRNSRLARRVEAPVYNYVPPLLFYYFSYWSDVPSDGFETYTRHKEQRVVFSFRTSDGLFAIFAGWPMELLPEVRADIDAAFMSVVDSIPDFSERVRMGRRVERYYGATDLANFYRRSYGPGWALVGDAGCHKDPYLALGICDALRDAEFLAEAISTGLSGQEDVESALSRYERQRNEASEADFQQNVAAASFQPVPKTMLALRGAVRNNTREATRLAMAREGMIDPDEFFGPENVQRLLGAAAKAR